MTCRSLAMFADDDLVTPQHMVEMYNGLPNAELAIVPGTSHFLTQEKPELVNKIVVDFLTREPVPTVAPIRRAPKPEPVPARAGSGAVRLADRRPMAGSDPRGSPRRRAATSV